ncbi:MAG: hypothetical protein ACYC1D_17180, partial [Acidimicrobiales bacterium]
MPEGAGRWLAGALDGWWSDLGCPDPYLVAEVGADGGRRAAEALAAGPACAPALRYILVDDPPVPPVAGVTVESPALVLGPVRAGDGDEPAEPLPGRGPLLGALGELPAVEGPLVVVAIDWVSGLPADRFERSAVGWSEVRLGAPAGGGICELLVAVDPATAAELDRLVARRAPESPAVAVGQRIDRQVGARAWLGSALAAAGTGRVAVVDRFVAVTGPRRANAPGVALDQLVSLRRPAGAPTRAVGLLDTGVWRGGGGGSGGGARGGGRGAGGRARG